MTMDQGISRTSSKMGQHINNKTAKATARMEQWAIWHNLQKDNRKLIKQNKIADYESSILDAKDAQSRGDQSANWKIIATISGKDNAKDLHEKNTKEKCVQPQTWRQQKSVVF